MSSELSLPVDSHSGGDMLKVRVQLFAAAAQRAGTRQLQLCVPRGANLTQLCRQLVQHCPELELLASNSRWAAGYEFVDADYCIHQEVELAMIPPVSGG